MIEAEGKLFKPLACTKTATLMSSIVISLLVLPMIANLLFRFNLKNLILKYVWIVILLLISVWALFNGFLRESILVLVLSLAEYAEISKRISNDYTSNIKNATLIMFVALWLSRLWLPIGPNQSEWWSFVFVVIILLFVIGFFLTLIRLYERILRFLLVYWRSFMIVTVVVIVFSATIWLGWRTVFMNNKKMAELLNRVKKHSNRVLR